jgi:hypothetical protein
MWVVNRRLEPGVQDAAMVRNDVKHQPETACSGGAAQREKGLVPSKMRVGVVVIHHVITMIAERGEYRREVQSVDSEFFEVIKVLFDPFQVAAKELNMRVTPIGRRLLSPPPSS